MYRGFRKVLVIVALSVVATTLISIGEADASDYWGYDYEVVGIPDTVLTGPTPFTVETRGSEPVCSMTFQNSKLTKAPWTFTYRLGGEDQVSVNLCNGQTTFVSVYANLPWLVWGGKFNTRDSYYGNAVDVTIKSEIDEPSAVVISYKGKQVGAGEIAPKGTGSIPFTAVSKEPVAIYQVEVTGIVSNTRMSFPAVVSNMWQSMNEGLPSYPRCSLVYWKYDASGAPQTASATNVKSDIRGALNLLGRETGLKFVETSEPVTDANAATLTFDWNIGPGHSRSAGTGTFITSGESVKGEVHLSPTNWWSKSDAYRGFALVRKPKTISGRGWLMVHEVMHTMGIDHTTYRSEVMYATMSRQTKLGKGDLAALHYLYQPESCKAS